MKTALLASLCFFVATICQARLGETKAAIETRFGKPIKEALPWAPATSANVYQKGARGYTVGFVDGKAVYEVLQVVDDDGDFGESTLIQKDQDAFLKMNDLDGEWTQAPDSLDGFLHYSSAHGKYIATYEKKHHALTVESVEFRNQRH